MTTGLLKTNPLEAMAQRKVEQKGPTSILKFPRNLGAHGTLMRFFEYKYGGKRGSEMTPLAEILLPLPKQIQDNFKINVGGNELGITGTTAAQLAGNPDSATAIGRALGESAVQAVDALSDGLGDAVGGDFSGVQKALDSATNAAQFLTRGGMGSVAPDISNGIGVGRGTAINPFATLVFSGVDLKVHSLEWLLSPESEKESKQLKTIIRTLQRMVLPKGEGVLSSETGAAVLDRGILRYPAMVDTYFQGIDESYFFRFKTSMISQLSVDYTPNGIAVNKGGKPSVIRITMTLNEAYIHTADDNSASDLLEETIQEKIDGAITDNLTSNDGEFAPFDASIVSNPEYAETYQGNQTSGVSQDEVTITTVTSTGSTSSKVVTKEYLKSEGYSDSQIDGTASSGANGVTFTPGTGS